MLGVWGGVGGSGCLGELLESEEGIRVLSLAALLRWRMQHEVGVGVCMWVCGDGDGGGLGGTAAPGACRKRICASQCAATRCCLYGVKAKP